MPKSGYIGVFSSSGKLVAFSDDSILFRETVRRVEETLPSRGSDHASGLILTARKAALKSLVSGNDDE